MDGSDAKETVTFSLGATSYEIDLSAKNPDKFRKALAPWIDIARKTSGTRRSSGSSSPNGVDPKAVRV